MDNSSIFKGYLMVLVFAFTGFFHIKQLKLYCVVPGYTIRLCYAIFRTNRLCFIQFSLCICYIPV